MWNGGEREVVHLSFIVSFSNKREREANAMAKSLAVSPGYGRTEMHRRAVRGVLGAGRKPRAKPRLEAWLVSCGESGLHFDLLSEVGVGFAVGM